MIYKVNMAQKRPSDVQNSDDVSIKHPRLAESSDITSTYLDDVTSVDPPHEHINPGEGDVAHGVLESTGKQANESQTQLEGDVDEDAIAGLPSSLSLSPWVTSSTSEDDDTAEIGLHLPILPDYFTFDRPASVRSVIHADDAYHILMDYPPRKLVPIGPEHQADLPEWGPESYCDYDNILCGICVVPAPQSELPLFSREKAGDERNDCSCLDRGSVRCVRQHVLEAREGLRKTIGEIAFLELGFADMGEVVAERWAEDEADLFHEVVYSNPASAGKNFWSTLSIVFPSRTKMEIVSYYFNVFMLRKRAGQNRVHQMSIDSDNDEWQGCDSDVYGEGAMTDEDDSVVESPVDHHGPGHYETLLADHEEDILDDTSADENTDLSYSKRKPISTYQVPEKSHCDDSGGNDTHRTQVNSDGCDQWRDYVLEPCDSKVWDGYMNCPKNKVDLLPTCSMIKEVFGDGASFDLQGKRW